MHYFHLPSFQSVCSRKLPTSSRSQLWCFGYKVKFNLYSSMSKNIPKGSKGQTPFPGKFQQIYLVPEGNVVKSDGWQRPHSRTGRPIQYTLPVWLQIMMGVGQNMKATRSIKKIVQQSINLVEIWYISGNISILLSILYKKWKT